MSFICWNARGSGSLRAFRNLSLLVKQHKPCFLFVMETKLGVGSSFSFKSRLSFDNILEIPRRGLGGGLLLFWTAAIDVHINNYSSNHVDCFVSMTDNSNTKWHVSCFYGSPYVSEKPHTWTLLHRLYDIAPSMPWLILGDLNDYLTVNDKSSTNNPPVYAIHNFQSFISKSNLSPMPCIGNKFTWKHGKSFERLDWCIANDSWFNLFPFASLHHLGFFGSDHRALKILLSDPHHKHTRSHHFMCENFWFSEPDFLSVVEDGWKDTLSNFCPSDPLRTFMLRQESCLRSVKKWGSNDVGVQLLLSFILNCLSDVDVQMLNEPFTSDEVKAALFQMAGDKAPGLDGVNAMFYQKNWSTLGSDLCVAVLSILNNNADISTINDTVIVVIPKKKNATKIRDFRPISLCSTVYKIVSKVLANRLKDVLNGIISQNQSAFIQNRVIFYNVFIANEIVNAINHRKLGKSGWVALKLDMEKAFDRVEWGFVKAIMQHLHFPDRFINLILNCISSVSFQLLINGSLTNKFSSSRGLRLQEHHKLFQGISICRSAPVILHLLFADDSLLSPLLRPVHAWPLKMLLICITRQVVNFSKSCALFSPNTIASESDFFRTTPSLDNKPFINKYLGIPQCFGRSKTDHFNFLLQKISSNMNSWTNHFFSKAGKEVLLKAVVQDIPSYAMSCFRIPISICKKIESVMAKFWWSSSGNKGKVHWKSWEKLCQSKFSGGLGFRSFVHHNQALLSKQAWRVFSMPNSLLARLLKAKYFKQNSFLEATKGHCPSFTWRSLLWGRDLLKRGLLWKERLSTYFDEEVMHAILSVPISDISMEDTLIWEHHPSGFLTVSSAYHLANSIYSLPTSSSNVTLVKWCSESVTHALIECSRASREWKDSRFKNFYLLNRSGDICEFLLKGFQDFSKEELRLFLGIIWEIWNRRNISLINKNKYSLSSTDFQVSCLLQDFDDAQIFHDRTGPQLLSSCSSGNSTSIMPKPGSFKLNVDAALSDHLRKVGIGVAVY
ncbi:uncharacterized protein LOC133035987 [Cannabis sativa]|uniref:uncharacterized protein LOC133035987 n=1 Tax=Cannabis sativa TaxID=3483 RepID=UPI0029C9BC6F|nr:uncharacterized protein LOC133035987 [Cannabis sativa]